MVILQAFGYLFFNAVILSSVLLGYKGIYDYILPFICSLLIVFLLEVPFSFKYKRIVYLINWVYFLIIGIQIASLWNSGYLVQDLILSNIDEISSVGLSVIYSSVTIIGVFLFLAILGLGKKGLKLSGWAYLTGIILGVILLFFVPARRLPLCSFLQSVNAYFHQMYFKFDGNISKQQKYIYGKNWVYQNDKADVTPDLRGKNIVTIFSEGFSAKIIDKNSGYPNLTYNISNLMDKSVWFDNYFNHTASTYRGIRGQLSSSYQYAGVGNYPNVSVDTMNSIVKGTVIGIPDILRDNGYHTYFLCAHKESDHMISYLNTMGFEKVFDASDFIQQERDLTDKELFYYLGKLLQSGQLQEPYFIGIYNIGTHFGKSSPDAYYVYNGQEADEVVSVFYNFDVMFGSFLYVFEKDEYLRKNTAIILTSDHATFPSNEYKKAFDDNRDYFMSTIPFILYYDGIQPQRIDVGGRNSLDFAPTLLNWLRINKAHNYFLGCSLYDEKCHLPFEFVYTLGIEAVYTTTGKRLHSTSNEHDKNLLRRIYNFYHLTENHGQGVWSYPDGTD